MDLDEKLVDMYDIKYGNPLYEIEHRVSMICTALESEKLHFNRFALQSKVNRLNEELHSLTVSLFRLTNKRVSNILDRKSIATFLIINGVSSDRVKTFDGKYKLTKSDLVQLDLNPSTTQTQASKDVVKLLLKGRELKNYINPAETFLNNFTKDYFYPTYTSVGVKSGTIASSQPNLVNTPVLPYIIPNETKKIVSIDIANESLFLLATLLKDSFVYDLYSKPDGFTELASILKGVPVGSVPDDVSPQVEMLKRIFGHLHGSDSSDGIFIEISDGLPARVLDFLRSASLLNPRLVKTMITPSGRTISEANQITWCHGVLADYSKSALVKITQNIDYATPKLVRASTIYFEIPRGMAIEDFHRDVESIYTEITPRGYFVPKLKITEHVPTSNSEEVR